jgi:uncharacterized membrane protein
MDTRPNPFPPDGFRGGGSPFRGALVERVGGGGPGALAWAIFALVLALLLLAIASLAIDAYHRARDKRRVEERAAGVPPAPEAHGPALATLDNRYARGEIPREEYLQARDDLRTTEATTQVIPTDPEPATS